MLHFNYHCANCRNVFHTDVSSLLIGASFRCPHCKALYRVVGEAGVVQRVEMESADRYSARPSVPAERAPHGQAIPL